MSWREILEIVPSRGILILIVGVLVIVAIQMFRGDALVCPDGSIFAKTCDPITAVDLPGDAVVAFASEDGCPVGWEEYRDAEGRFIVGAGRHSDHNRYGNSVINKNVGDKGGEDQVKLEIEHMPRHRHQNPTRGSGPKGSVGALQAVDDGFSGERHYKHRRPTAFEGSDKPHDNMPPYVALLYCKRDVSDSSGKENRHGAP